jgi:hypothetical protein
MSEGSTCGKVTSFRQVYVSLQPDQQTTDVTDAVLEVRRTLRTLHGRSAFGVAVTTTDVDLSWGATMADESELRHVKPRDLRPSPIRHESLTDNRP